MDLFIQMPDNDNNGINNGISDSDNSNGKNKIKVVSLNARSLKTVNSRVNKLVELQNIADTTESQVIAITETWLDDNVSDTETLSNDFTLYRRDRGAKRGGGILPGDTTCC